MNIENDKQIPDELLHLLVVNNDHFMHALKHTDPSTLQENKDIIYHTTIYNKGLFYLFQELLLAETVGRSQDPVHIWIGISLHYNTLTLIYE
jgi:hypothetical protein